jgi:hypothetical protein
MITWRSWVCRFSYIKVVTISDFSSNLMHAVTLNLHKLHSIASEIDWVVSSADLFRKKTMFGGFHFIEYKIAHYQA